MRISLTAKILGIVGISFLSTLAVSAVSIYQMSEINDKTQAVAKQFLPLNQVISQIILLQHEQNKILTNVARSVDNKYAFTKGYFLRARTDLAKTSIQIKDNLDLGKKLLQQENQNEFTNSFIGTVHYEMQYVEDILMQFSKNAYEVFSNPDNYISTDVVAQISSLIDQQQFISDRLYRLENQLIQLTFQSAQHAQQHEKAALSFIFWFSLGAFLISVGVTLFLVNSLVSRPIKKILQFWSNMHEGNLNVDLDVYSNDEIGELAKASRSYLDALCEKKAMEEEIQESYSRLAFSINSMRDGFVVYDKNDRLVMVNQAFLDFYDCIHDEVKPGITYENLVRASLAKGMWDIGGWDTEDWVQSQLKNRSDDTFDFETEGRLADGRIMLRRERRDATGQIVGIRIDVTEMHRKEEELRQHKENLEEIVIERTALIAEQTAQLEEALATEQQLNEMQRQFVSMASHEFRTPLAIIDSSAQRLLRKKGKLTDEDLSKRIGIILESVQRMSSLMESTLSAARLNAGKLSIQISDCDIAGLIESVCARQQEISHHHVINCDELDLPNLIQADKVKVDQVITNLLSNAVKYAPDAPFIAVKAHHDNSHVFISVQDEGLGINDDDLPNMFEQFFRARTSTGIAGTGIGLHIVKQIIDFHGGEITVSSEVGVGTTFTVRLPIAGPLEIAA